MMLLRKVRKARTRNRDFAALGVICMGAIGVIDTAADAEPVLGWLDQLHIKAAYVVAGQDAESYSDEGYRYMEAPRHVDQLLDARKAKKAAKCVHCEGTPSLLYDRNRPKKKWLSQDR